ncbi:MAG: hypothetical protein WBP42_11555 [Candidatus Zixiibacteriota bacterium]
MFRRFMLRLLILSLPVLPLVAANIGEKRAVDEIGDYLNEPLNSNGATVKPDSAAVRMLKLGTGQVYFAFSTTFPFNDIGIALVVNREDSAYYWSDQIQDIDGAGGLGTYTATVILYSATDAMDTKFQFDVKTNSVEAVDARIMANLDALVSSRLAPAVAGRTLAVNVIGCAGVDFDATSGLIGAGDLETNAFTATKFADGFLTGAKIGAGAIGATQAPNLDAAVSSRLAPGGTLAAVTSVTQLGGTTAGIAGLNGMFDGNENYVNAELHILGNLSGYVRLGPNGLDGDSSFTGMQTKIQGIKDDIAVGLDVPVSSRLAPTVPARTLGVTAGGHASIDLNTTTGTLDAAEFGTDFITNTKIQAGAITSSEAPNLDVAVSTRLAPSGTLANVTVVGNVQNLGGSGLGIAGLNEVFDNDAVVQAAEITVTLAANGTANDTRITGIINSLATAVSASDSLESWIQVLLYAGGSCDGCSTRYIPDDGTGYKDAYEVYQGGAKKFTMSFYHANNPAVLDARKARKE